MRFYVVARGEFRVNTKAPKQLGTVFFSDSSGEKLELSGSRRDHSITKRNRPIFVTANVDLEEPLEIADAVSKVLLRGDGDVPIRVVGKGQLHVLSRN